MKIMLSIVGFVLGVVLGDAFLRVARGAPQVAAKGLFAEVAAAMDGATIRRIRDREEGVVCYVATGPQVNRGLGEPMGRHVAISCLRAQVNP